MIVIYKASTDHLKRRFKYVPQPSSVFLTESVEQQYFHFLESLGNVKVFPITSDGGIKIPFQDAFMLGHTLTPVISILKLLFYK